MEQNVQGRQQEKMCIGAAILKREPNVSNNLPENKLKERNRINVQRRQRGQTQQRKRKNARR